MLFTTEKREASSAKSLQFEERSFDKSFMPIRNNKGPKIEPCGTPAVTSSQDECGPFRTTRRFHKRENRAKVSKVSKNMILI